jgi:hypothetical protein
MSIEGGPQFSFLLKAEDNSGNSLKDEIKKSDFGLAAGITLHAPIGLNGGARYVYGFTNINNLENDHEIKNKMIQLFVGWTIFLEPANKQLLVRAKLSHEIMRWLFLNTWRKFKLPTPFAAMALIKLIPM